MVKAETKNTNSKEIEQVKINVKSDTIKGSLYSQIVSITVTDIDITLEFVYLNPRIRTEGEVVARITLPRKAGEGLAKAIEETIVRHEANRQKEKHGTN